MTRTVTLLLVPFFASTLFALTGGPDQYGYIWKDSAEPDGPVFNWVDITGNGIQITGLADDNIVGPFVCANNMPFYWYSRKRIWFSSNGYIAFQNGNIAAPFPTIPTPGGTNDYIAAFMTDLNFQGAGNPAQCFIRDNLDSTIISYINVPFWTSVPPLWTGGTTFQYILNKNDSTITIQYQGSTGFSSANGPICGIESITGDIGLLQSNSTYPAAGYAVRFYNPPHPLLEITDGAVTWVTDDGSGGQSLAQGTSVFPLHTFIENTGNQNIGNFNATVQVLDSNNVLDAADATIIDTLQPGQAHDLVFSNSFTPANAGTHHSITTISGIPNELYFSNNSRTQELVVYDTTQFAMNVDWAGSFDDGAGISWNGGDGGVGMYILPPFYPMYVTHTTVRIVNNFGNVGFTMKVYDDDGLFGGPGTLLDSIMVDPVDAQIGDHMYPLVTPFVLSSGGLYVQWYMQGQNVSIAQDIQPPFSLRSYEVIQGVWAQYRSRETADFHLGLRMEHLPIFDVGCSRFSGLTDGQVVSTTTNVQTWIRNYGNQPVTNIPCHYRFNAGSIVDQTYVGPLIQGHDSVLFTFAVSLQPLINATGELCTWTTMPNDALAANDTTCITIDIVAGIAERNAQHVVIGPNPAHTLLSIAGIADGNVHAEIFAMTGALERSIMLHVSGGKIELRVDDLVNGAYMLRLSAKDNVFTGRFVVE